MNNLQRTSHNLMQGVIFDLEGVSGPMTHIPLPINQIEKFTQKRS